MQGYEAWLVDDNLRGVPHGTIGRLAVRGPTGCRYLGGDRQPDHVRNGWNLTGDSFVQDQDGYFRAVARNDNLILSAGSNIAGPEAEAALLAHDAVWDCAVIGVPDKERGYIVEAHVVLADGMNRRRRNGSLSAE